MLGPSVANFAKPAGVSKPATFEAAIKPAVIIVAIVTVSCALFIELTALFKCPPEI